jgi:hypothetical protein
LQTTQQWKKGEAARLPLFSLFPRHNFLEISSKAFFKKIIPAPNSQSAISGQYFRKISVWPTFGDAGGALSFGCSGDAGDGGRATKPRWTLAPAPKRRRRRFAPRKQVAPPRTAAPANLRARKYL